MAKTRRPSGGARLAWVPPSPTLILILLALTLAIRFAFAEGLFFDEGLTIAGDASSLYSFEPAGPDGEPGILARAKEFLRELRTLPSESWPVTVGLGLFYTLFGVNDLVSLMPGLLSSLLAGGLIYILGKQMFDEPTGLLAAFLWAIAPLSVFLSISLMPVLPLIAIDLLAVTLFFRAAQGQTWGGFLPAAVLVAIGSVLDWTLFLPTGIFMVIDQLRHRQVRYSREIGVAGVLMILAALLFLGGGAAAVELYGLNLQLFDNFLFIPLLVIGLVSAAGVKGSTALRFVLPWLGVKAAFIVVAAPLILQRPQLQTIGFAGYWLDLIPPGLILIAFHFARWVEPVHLKRMLVAVGSVSAVGLIFLIPIPGLPAFLATILRISVGVAFMWIFVYLALLRKDAPSRNALLLGSLLIFLTLASISIVSKYVASYIYPVEDANGVRAALASVDGDQIVFVGDELVYERLLYLGGYQNPQRLDEVDTAQLNLLNPVKPDDVPEGAYVVVSSHYLNFVLGIPPTNWEIFREFSHSGQERLIMYHVGAEDPE